MQHKLESGYKSVRQQQSISPLHQALALSSSVSFSTITGMPAKHRCAGNWWWQGKQVFPNRTNTQGSTASQYNANLKQNNKNPTTKKETNEHSAQQWDLIKYSCTSNKSMLSLLCRACCSYSCCWSQRHRTCEQAIKRSEGSTSSLGLRSASCSELSLLGCLRRPLSQGFPNSACSGAPWQTGNDVPIMEGRPQDQQQLRALHRAMHRHSDAIPSGPLLSDECRAQARAVLCWADDDKFDFFPILLGKYSLLGFLFHFLMLLWVSIPKVSGTAATVCESEPEVTDVKPKTARTRKWAP